MGVDVEILDYEPRYREDFERLNLEWIGRYFTIEPADREVLGDPEHHLIRPGGAVLFARLDGRIVGTCGLETHGPGTVELVKMGVTEAVQGRGVGRRLLEAAIDRARALGNDTMCLWTSSRLKSAIALYEKLGFRRVEPPEPGTYERADVYMALAL